MYLYRMATKNCHVECFVSSFCGESKIKKMVKNQSISNYFRQNWFISISLYGV